MTPGRFSKRRAAQLERIGEARAHTVHQAPARPSLDELRVQERELTHSVTGLERYVEELQHYGRREQRIAQRREPRTWQAELAAERVLAAGPAHGLPRDHHAEQVVARLERPGHLQEAVRQLRGLAQALAQDEPAAGSALRVRLFEREEEREREPERGRGW
jgi:hypothetical protein